MEDSFLLSGFISELYSQASNHIKIWLSGDCFTQLIIDFDQFKYPCSSGKSVPGAIFTFLWQITIFVRYRLEVLVQNLYM